MKTGLKYLPTVAIAIAALTWFSLGVRSTEGEEEGEVGENPAAREAFRRLLLQDENGQIPPDGLRTALEQKQAMLFRPEAWGEFLPDIATVQTTEPPPPNPWVSIGPGNIGGRIRSLVIHPDSPTRTATTMWVGGVAGGVWKTTNGGTSWSTNTDHLANLAVNCMAMDPANPDILYAGTGEGFYNDDGIQGYGIFKTTNGGTTWLRLLSTTPTPQNPDFYFVNRIAICPTNSQLLLAATRSGKILRSADGGGTWSTRLASVVMEDVLFQPKDGTAPPEARGMKCIAGNFLGEVFYSTNAGLDWSPAFGVPQPGGFQRVELAYSRSKPWIVYASAAANGQLYRSTNSGISFISMGTPPGGTGVTYYRNSLWVDPTNADTVLVGGDNLWRTTLGGAGGWTSASVNTHPDHHVMVEHPGYNGVTNKIVYGGNDGGIYRTDDVLVDGEVTWTGLNNNLGITQFYGAAGHVASDAIIGGTQDNGTLRSPVPPSQDWTTKYYSDGGFCAVDQTNNPYFYGEYTFLTIHRSTDRGFNTTGIWEGIPHPPECDNHPCADFIAPFVLDPNNENRILAGGRSLWRSNNVRDPQPSEVSWTEIKGPVIDGQGRYVNISAIAVAPGNSDLVWVGYDNGSVYFTTNGTASTPIWILRNTGLPGRRCTRITINSSPQVVRTTYATFGGFNADNVWKTENNGQTWMDISGVSGRLPSAPIHSLVISPSDPDRLYVGTEVGVFASPNGGATWSPSAGDHPIEFCIIQ